MESISCLLDLLKDDRRVLCAQNPLPILLAANASSQALGWSASGTPVACTPSLGQVFTLFLSSDKSFLHPSSFVSSEPHASFLTPRGQGRS